MRAASAEDDALDGRTADQTGLASAHVHAMLKLEKALFAFSIHVVGNRRSAQLDGFFQHFLHRGVEAIKLCACEPSSLASRANAGAKQRFVSVDVSYAVEQFLVQQSSFDGSLASAE